MVIFFNCPPPIPLLVGNTEPEGGRGDSGYYLPGIGVAPRVSLATIGGRDAPRLRTNVQNLMHIVAGGIPPPPHASSMEGVG